jgi:hypothetical protein
MTRVLDRLPVLSAAQAEAFGERHAEVKRHQILVWVGVHLAEVAEPEANAPWFPGILDTGNNFGFSMQHRHLREWAGIDPQLLPHLGGLRIDERMVDRCETTLWLYPNIPGTRKPDRGARPHLLEMREGIALYPRDAIPPGPRLPLLGLPALLDNDLDLWLDPEARRVSVQTRTWRRRLMRLLCRL